MRQPLSEYLVIVDLSGKKKIQCRKCDYVFCPVTENFKTHAVMHERPLREAGLKYSETERFILREFYCPKCATLLEVEMCLEGESLIYDQVRI